MKKSIITNSILTIIMLILGYLNAPNLNPLYGDGAFTLLFVLSLYIFVNAVSNLKMFNLSTNVNGQPVLDLNKNFSFKKGGIITIIALWVLFFIVVFGSSSLFNWRAYKDQMKEPEVKTFSNDMSIVDVNQVPIVDKALATKLADKKLGEKPSLGSQVTLGEPTIQQVNKKLMWVVPLRHSGFFKWLTNMDGTPGYVTVSATNVQDVKNVENFKVKIQPNLYFNDDLTRTVRFKEALFKGITDYSFEIDDEGNPFWVVTTYKNMRGFALPEADGVVLVNASSGETKSYSLKDVPNWVDRVQPEDFIMRQINNKGQFVEGIFNFSNRNKFQTSEGSIIIYNQDRCYLFTGITSVGADESAIGFYMVDMVTKQATLYQMPGATEYSAMNSAQGNVQDLGYTATFPVVLNVSGQPTYFMTLKDNEGLIKQFAFVSIKDYSVVGTADTVSGAMKNFEKSMINTAGKSNEENQEPKEKIKVSGTVDRIGVSVESGYSVYIISLVENAEKLYKVSIDKSSTLSITKPGDLVLIEYQDEQPIIIATSFENKTINK
jgi:hypothetical protein